ncbi:MAG: pitrilysin family protein [Acidobacteria bacterium]|nr:pitrilysin family protein [Acidobacteriota bacterium]MDA1233380.1 pitrilysin family protein [Acidobacteriota bacterium]
MRTRLLALFLLLGSAGLLPAQEVQVQEYVLENGMRLLLVPREGDPNIACGWVARVGSVNERPGITGVAHLFEHMMFKGTHAIGTTDIDRDLEIIAKLDEIKGQIREEEAKLTEAYRIGAIDDPTAPGNRSDRHKELLSEFDLLLRVQSELLVKDEFTRIYTSGGGSGMNAFTSNDMTAYFVNVPSNKLELWFWMESDRLANPVFREFYAERDVVREERRLRTDSTPTGKINEQFEAMFWMASPYSWPVVGWSNDVENITREEALEFWNVYYAPNNLTMVLVGDFKPDDAKALADKYLARLQRGAKPPPPMRTREIKQLAEKRLIAYAETRPMVRARFHTVPDANVDEPPLLVLGSILNGRTGRFFKSLVLEKQLAVQAGGGVNGLKYDGMFELVGIARDPAKLLELEQGLYDQMEILKNELVTDRELQKIKNQQLAADFRRLESKSGLMTQLLQYEALGQWENINRFSERIQAVTPEDIQRVARKYFTPENRNVALYYPKDFQPAAASEGEAQ